MKHEIRRYFDFWMDFYRVPKEKREKVYLSIDRLFEAFDDLVGPNVSGKWKENRHSSKAD